MFVLSLSISIVFWVYAHFPSCIKYKNSTSLCNSLSVLPSNCSDSSRTSALSIFLYNSLIWSLLDFVRTPFSPPPRAISTNIFEGFLPHTLRISLNISNVLCIGLLTALLTYISSSMLSRFAGCST